MSFTNTELEDYCRPFIEANSIWPQFPEEKDVRLKWWLNWVDNISPDNIFPHLCKVLPQLLINH